MADITHTIGSTGVVKRQVDLGGSIYADAVVASDGRFAADEVVLAAATGSTGGLGKIGTVPEDGWIYARCDCSGGSYKTVDWRVQASKIHDVLLYKSRSIVDKVTLTLGSFADTETLVLNGLTYTGEETAADAAYAARKFLTGVGNTADAAALTALINADYAVTTAGTSVAATDKLVITTDEGAHTIVAAATADYPGGKYALSATVGTELASIVLAINHAQNVTCATSIDDDTVTVNGMVFTSAAAEDLEANEFDNDASDNATATSLAACINHATYGVEGVTAVASANVVYLYRDSEDDAIALSSSDGTTLACVTTVGGVPGVIAAASGATGELSITPTWSSVLTVTEAGDQLTVVDIDCPGVYATSAEAVVTLVPGTPASQSSGELATVIHAVDASSHAAVSQAATLLGLTLDAPRQVATDITDIPVNSTTAGTLYEQDSNGYEYCYCGVMNDSGDASVAAMVVGATRRI